MSWQHRDYAHANDGGPTGRVPIRGSGMQTLSITTILILANVGVALVTFGHSELARTVLEYGVMQPEAVLHGQVWRLWTATFMHAGFGHIFMNMLGLYFLGPPLERVWGSRQFLLVYTLGGVAGNVLFALAGLVGWINPLVIGVGASGSVIALLGAAAVLFPDAEVYVYFLFPVRIRTVAFLYGGWFVYNIITRGANYGGDMSHIAGLLVGVWWAMSGGWSLSGRHRTRIDPRSLLGRVASRMGGSKRGDGAWEGRMRQRRDDEELVDRLLEKVQRQGMQSLTAQERQALVEASHRRRAADADLRGHERER